MIHNTPHLKPSVYMPQAKIARPINEKQLAKSKIHHKTLEHVLQIGYKTNIQAHSLNNPHSHIIGLLVPEVGNSYIGTIMSGIDEELIAHQYELLLYTTHRHKISEIAHVDTIKQGLADGLIILLPTNIDAYLDRLQAEQFPHVILDHPAIPNSMTSTVQATNWQGAYDATRYLIELGHQRIATIVGLKEMQTALDRLEGFKAAMHDYGLEIDPYLIFEGDFYRTEGYEATCCFLQNECPPTAILAANDYSAFGVLDAIRDAGLQVPNDISVIGFDDIPEAMHIHPQLTTVRQPLQQMGQVAMQLLFSQLETPSLVGERVEISTQLVIRNSCGPAPTP